MANNNGRVGVFGVSYPGFLATMAGINPHPAVKAISPQAPMTDTWMGDDFFHQGAFRLSYGFEYAGDLELSKDQSVPSADLALGYVRLVSRARAAGERRREVLPRTRPDVAGVHRSIRAYDAYWQARAVERVLKSPAVPTLTVGGWWDQEDRWGPLATYKALEPGDTKHWNFLVMGPWNHGGWRNPARAMPVVDPGTADAYLRDVEAPWFAYWLHDKGKHDASRRPTSTTPAPSNGARSTRGRRRSGASDGSSICTPNGTLSFDAPKSEATQYDQFVSDPAHPVPYRPRPVEQTYDPRGSRWRTWETQDQRFVQGRPDVLTWSRRR